MTKKTYSEDCLKLTYDDLATVLGGTDFTSADIESVDTEGGPYPIQISKKGDETAISNGVSIDKKWFWFEWSDMQSGWAELTSVDQDDVSYELGDDFLTIKWNFGPE